MINLQQNYPHQWKTESIPPKIRNKTKVSTSTTIIQHDSGSPSYSDQRTKRNKRNQDRKRCKALTVYTWHDTVYLFSSVQSLSRVRLSATPWIGAWKASLSITSSRNLFKFMSMESVIPSSQLILCRPLLLLPPILPSISVFSSKST